MIERSAASRALPLRCAASVYSSPAGRAPVGGDWCAVRELPAERVALMLGDVAGHGRSIAGKMHSVRASMLLAIETVSVPSHVLAIGNEVASGWGDGTLVTAIVAIVDLARRTLSFANAGHPPPLLMSGDQHTLLEHRPADLPLGVFAGYQAADYVLGLPLDALLVLYSDGITEHDRDLQRGEAELIRAARWAYARPHLDAARTIARRVLNRKRGHDDVAALALRTSASDDP